MDDRVQQLCDRVEHVEPEDREVQACHEDLRRPVTRARDEPADVQDEVEWVLPEDPDIECPVPDRPVSSSAATMPVSRVSVRYCG